MGNWPDRPGAVFTTIGKGTEPKGTVLPGGGANTKGAYTELVSAANNTKPSVGVYLWLNVKAPDDFLIDIAFGAAGSEIVIINNLLASSTYYYATSNLFIPIYIPSGTRISARAQTLSGTCDLHVLAVLVSQSFRYPPPLSLVTTWGANIADSGGLAVDPGTTVETKGSWVEMVASTATMIKSLFLCLGMAGASKDIGTTWTLDIGIGAAGSEKIILADLFYQQDGACFGTSSLGPYNVSIPIGSRIAVRTVSNTSTATKRLTDVVLYGVT